MKTEVLEVVIGMYCVIYAMNNRYKKIPNTTIPFPTAEFPSMQGVRSGGGPRPHINQFHHPFHPTLALAQVRGLPGYRQGGHPMLA
jgi:hypothetical protein